MYRFKKPFDNAEAEQRFELIEDRGERVLVQCIGLFEEQLFKPTFSYLKTEVLECTE